MVLGWLGNMELCYGYLDFLWDEFLPPLSCPPQTNSCGCWMELCSTADGLFWSSGKELSIPLFLHPKGNNQVPRLLVYKECKINSSSFETKLHRALLQAGRQHTGLALLVWKSEEWVLKGHLKMSTRLDTSLEIQIYMCKNIYWAGFAVTCLCNFCQIMSQEYHWNSRSCFLFNIFELGCSLF